MTDGPISPDPPRLSGDDDETARLLENAEFRYRVGLDEARAWERIERTRQRRVALSWAGSTCAVLVAGFILASNLLQTQRDSDVYVLRPEPPPVAQPLRAKPSTTPPPAGLASASQEPTPAPARVIAPDPVASSKPAPTESRCKTWLAEGKAERAVECFRTLSRNSGLDSEVALYEAARLTVDRLHDGARALGMLEEHRRRFPSSALRGEVGWLRVRSLHRAGRLDEALAESETLLATPTGRTLASELHALRGRIFQDQKGDCERAVREFVALLGEPGPRGDDAELRRARCLETLGRTADAADAYTRYLARPQPLREAEARARLSKLSE